MASESKFQTAMNTALASLESNEAFDLLMTQSQDTYRRILTRFWKKMKILPDLITEKHISKYLKEYNPKSELDYTPSSQTIKTNKNGILFYYRQVLKKDFKVKTKKRKDQKVFQTISKEQFKKMVATAKNARNKMILRIGLATGMRVSSMSKLKKSDIHIKLGKITLRNCKGGKTRHVYIKEQLQKHIEYYYGSLTEAQKKAQYFFLNPQLGRLNVRSFQKMFQKLRKKCGIQEQITLHTLRRTFATNLHSQNVSLMVIRENMGHASVKTTENYILLDENRIRNFISPLENLLDDTRRQPPRISQLSEELSDKLSNAEEKIAILEEKLQQHSQTISISQHYIIELESQLKKRKAGRDLTEDLDDQSTQLPKKRQKTQQQTIKDPIKVKGTIKGKPKVSKKQAMTQLKLN